MAEARMNNIFEVKYRFDAERGLLWEEIRLLRLEIRSLVEENKKQNEDEKKFQKLVLDILYSKVEKPSLSELPEVCKDNELRNKTAYKSSKEESSPLVSGSCGDSHMKKHLLISNNIDVELSIDCNISNRDYLNWIKRVKLEDGSSDKVV
ncbi:hypothetical protein PanWU01x14_040240 [Parasponia andersonii]|uniref:Uncharacterized protein n=1 Tax=Parasponia andersonii TaxID=3476 RepID=A0A2P5DR55_PARAD|nr:hypothetical protein PanWU01x14_040240 [Parasponia andersonii]